MKCMPVTHIQAGVVGHRLREEEKTLLEKRWALMIARVTCSLPAELFVPPPTMLFAVLNSALSSACIPQQQFTLP